MKTKQLLRICWLWIIMVLWLPHKAKAQYVLEYEHTEYVTIECGEVITLDPTKLSGDAGVHFRWYRDHLSNRRGVSSSFWSGESVAITDYYTVYTTLSGETCPDSYKCDVIGLKPGTSEVICQWYTESKYYTLGGGTTGYVRVRCTYKVTVKPTSNPQITLAVSDTCSRVVRGTNIKITPSVSGASVYYIANVNGYASDKNFWNGTFPSSGITLNEKTLYSYKIYAMAVKRGYPASDEFVHKYDVIEPGDFHVLLGKGADTHFKIISEKDKTCGIHFVPETVTGDFKIPSQINGYKVIRILSSAFKGCTGITSVEIPEGIDSINGGAFSECKALSTIKIPNTVTYLAGFSNCNFEKVEIPESVITIGYSAFYNCSNLSSIVLHEGLKNIYTSAFQDCTSLESVILPSTVESIWKWAFWGCTSLKEVVIPKSVKEIGALAFRNCNSLESVISLIEEPFPINEKHFGIYTDEKNYSDWRWTSATLYVPKGCKEKYASTEGWLLFNNIVEIENVSEIQLSKKNITLDLENNTSVTLTATVLPKNAVNKNVTWSSSNPEVATVEGGKVTAVGYGTAVITATATDGSGVSASCTVIVKKPNEPGPDPTGDDTGISKLDNVIYLEKMEAQAGSTATLSFKMKNSAAIRGFQFDLYLPEGVTVVKNAKGRIQGSLSKGRLDEDDEHTLTLQEQADGAIRFLCGSQYDETFMGNEGEVAKLLINIADDMADGDYSIILKEMRLSETDISKYYDTESVKSTLTISSYMIGDINGDCIVNVSDYIGIANHILGSTPTGFVEKAADVNEDNLINVSDYIGVANIILTGSPYGNSSNVKAAFVRANETDLDAMDNSIYVEPMTVDKGTTRATLSFMMKNRSAIRGFQFDLYLPDGMTAVKNAKGRIQCSLSNGRLPEDDEHTLTVQEQADGAIRFLCGSQYDETFTGYEGEIATLEINLAEYLSDGVYPIVLKNMRLSETDISKYYDSDYVETIFTIKNNDMNPPYISIEDFTIAAIGKETTMKIDLTNPYDVIKMVSFNYHLPRGLYLIEFSQAYRTSHITGENGDNDVSIGFDDWDAPIIGTEGPILNAILVADNSFRGGTILLSNILLKTPEGKEYSQSDLKYDLSTDDISDIVKVNIGNIPLYNLSGQRVEHPRKGLYIQGGKKVLVK